MKVIVTGAAGYIGRYVVKELLSTGGGRRNSGGFTFSGSE